MNLWVRDAGRIACQASNTLWGVKTPESRGFKSHRTRFGFLFCVVVAVWCRFSSLLVFLVLFGCWSLFWLCRVVVVVFCAFVFVLAMWGLLVFGCLGWFRTVVFIFSVFMEICLYKSQSSRQTFKGCLCV